MYIGLTSQRLQRRPPLDPPRRVDEAVHPARCLRLPQARRDLRLRGRRPRQRQRGDDRDALGAGAPRPEHRGGARRDAVVLPVGRVDEGRAGAAGVPRREDRARVSTYEADDCGGGRSGWLAPVDVRADAGRPAGGEEGGGRQGGL